MIGYGLPRNDDVANPDVVDIRLYGLKTSIGDKCYQKPYAKISSRRIWKKKERRRAKDEIESIMKDG